MPRLPYKPGLAHNTLAAGSILDDVAPPRPTLADVLADYPERAIFYVTRKHEQWRMVYLRQHSPKIFRTQHDAIHFAVRAARALAAAGFPAEVRVQGTDGRFSTEWTYLNDPYPPLG